MSVPMGAAAGSAGDVLSGTLPKVKDKVLVIGTVKAKGESGYELIVEEVRRGDDVLIGRRK